MRERETPARFGWESTKTHQYAKRASQALRDTHTRVTYLHM